MQMRQVLLIEQYSFLDFFLIFIWASFIWAKNETLYQIFFERMRK